MVIIKNASAAIPWVAAGLAIAVTVIAIVLGAV